MTDIIRKNSLVIIILLGIFLVALFFRTVNLSKYPVGFQIDEASLGYNAYSILKTGKSEAGIKWPLYVDTFGDNRPTGYNFLAVPPVAVFGLSVFATRFPGALFGALSVFPIFLLAYVVFKNKWIALSSSLFLAVAPWSIVLSRASAEAVVALFLILFGFYFVFKYLEGKKILSLVSGIICLALSFFFYHTPRVFVPMLFLSTILVYFWPYKAWRTNTFLKMLGGFIILSLISFLLIFIVKGGTGRFSQVNIFSYPETKLVMSEQIREDGPLHLSILETRAFHNKLVNFPLTFISNYFAYFTGDFLFVNGGLPDWYKVDKVGLILLIECPFIIYGVYLSMRSKNRLGKLPLFWILVAPITAAITVDDIPNINRVIVLFPMLELLAAVGFVSILSKVLSIQYSVLSIKIKYIIIGFFAFLLFFNFLYFLHQYFVHGWTHRTWIRNNGFNEMMQIVNHNYYKYDKIVMTKTGGGYPLVLFFSKYDPAVYQGEGSPKDVDYKGFGKYIFVPNECPSINSSVNLQIGTKVLFVDRGNCKVSPKRLKNTYVDVKREDGTVGFRVVY